MKTGIVTFRAEHTKSAAADVALKNRLYVSGWCLSGELINIRECDNADYRIALAYEDGVPVGVAVVTEDKNLQVFVRKAKRGHGYGRQLVNAVKSKGCYGICGADGEGKVFVNNGVNFR